MYKPQRTAHRSRGIALITTLLLLSLFTVMTLGMVIATTSDTLIDGYYNNFRGSFYAADSGLNVARQYMINQFASSVSSTWTPAGGTYPISTGQETTVLANLINTSSGFGSYNSSTGSQTGSWPGKFKIDSDPSKTYIGTPTCTPGPYTGPVNPCSGGSLASDTTISTISWSYPYQITAWGESRASEQNEVVENGSIVATVTVSNSGSYTNSFANYGTLFNSYPICTQTATTHTTTSHGHTTTTTTYSSTGSPFVTGTMSGPFFSNDSWNFGDTSLVGSGNYVFTDTIGAASPNVGYMYSYTPSGGSAETLCDQAPSSTDKNPVNGETISLNVPTGGFSVGQHQVPIPADTNNQVQAVVNGDGTCPVSTSGSPCAAPSQVTMAGALKALSGSAVNSYPSSGSVPSGVYLPYTTGGGGSCPCTFTGGGMYIQGNVDSMTLTASTNGSGHPTQVFTIVQGSTTTTVTVDLTGNTTTIGNGTTTKVVTGVPQNTVTGTEAAMVYVNGNLGDEATSGSHGSAATGLSGPSSGAAIQDQSGVTVTATGNVIVTGSLTYKEEPVTWAASGSTPADQLIAANNHNQVLGIYTSGGDIELQPPTSNQNMEIDASLAMIGNSSSGGLIAAWNQINNLNIVGGRIAMQAKQGNINTRNIWFDRRFGQNNFAPPWFPATTITSTTSTTYSTVNVQASRVSWVNTTAQ